MSASRVFRRSLPYIYAAGVVVSLPSCVKSASEAFPYSDDPIEATFHGVMTTVTATATAAFWPFRTFGYGTQQAQQQYNQWMKTSKRR